MSRIESIFLLIIVLWVVSFVIVRMLTPRPPLRLESKDEDTLQVLRVPDSKDCHELRH